MYVVAFMSFARTRSPFAQKSLYFSLLISLFGRKQVILRRVGRESGRESLQFFRGRLPNSEDKKGD
jgi:hypothetical protein